MSNGRHSRRAVLRAGTLAVAGAVLPGCGGSGRDEYATVAAGIWRHAPGIPDTLAGVLAELVRYGTLAPSTYNSQCWRFRATRDSITILPDPDRRSPAVDPDDHHLHVSLGCAAENIVQSAAAVGLGSFVETGPTPARRRDGAPGARRTVPVADGRGHPRAADDARRLRREGRAGGGTRPGWNGSPVGPA